MKKGQVFRLVLGVLFLIGMSGSIFALPDDQNLRNAIQRNSTTDALKFLGYGYSADPNYVFYVGNIQKSVLTLAIEQQNLEIVQALVNKGAKTDFGGMQTETPLIVAAKIGNDDIVRYLVGLGGNLNAQDVLGNTALHYAAGAGGRSNRAVINTLLRSNARDSSSILNKAGETPFIVAIRESNPVIATAFVDSDRFDVVRPDDNGIPPILAAIQHNISLPALRAMLQKSDLPPADIMDNRTNNAYYYVKQYRNNNSSYVKLLDEFQLLKE